MPRVSVTAPAYDDVVYGTRTRGNPDELAFLEIPISYFARTEKEGKKFGWGDGFKAISALFVFRVK
jgi:hypothetical protein